MREMFLFKELSSENYLQFKYTFMEKTVVHNITSLQIKTGYQFIGIKTLQMVH